MVVLLFAGLVSVLYMITHTINSRSYDQLERRDVEVAVSRAQDAIANRVDSLSRHVADYGAWDDTYAFVQGEYPSYVDDNFLPEAMASLGVDFMAVANPDSRTVDGRAVDVASGEPLPLPGYVSAMIASAALDEGYDPGQSKGSGVITTDRGPLLFATQPITSSDGSKSTRSFLMTGRLLDAAETDTLSTLTHLSIAVREPGETPTPVGGAVTALAAVKTAPTEIVSLREDEVTGHTQVSDFAGRPSFGLEVTIPRTIHQVGSDASRLLGYALIAFGLVSTTLVGNAMFVQHHEVVDRTRAEEQALASEQRYRDLIDHMADAVFCLDEDGHITFANPRAAKLTGMTVEDLTACSFSSLISADALEPTTRRFDRALALGASESFEVDLVRARGEAVQVEINSSPIRTNGGSPIGVQWIARDVTDRKRFEQQLVHLATRDHLTGLPNRRLFEDQLGKHLELAARDGRSGAVLWFDLDYFKDINDSLGHGVGDEVLIGLARTLDRNLRAGSMLARIGGDEFAVLLPDANGADAATCAARLLDDIRTCPLQIAMREVSVTASIGVVLFPDHASTAGEILSRADLAMYRAKQNGRNQYCIYQPNEGWQTELQARLDWTMLIDQALRNDGFVVHAQPVLNLQDGGIDRYELLVRMEDPSGALILPGVFLPVAERTGQISEIDRWMVRRAIDFISMTTSPEEPCRLDVNLSGLAFSDEALLTLIESELIRTGIEPSLFGVEITETAAVADMGKARDFIETLKRLGCRVALDDFGSGFSSFYYLRNLPIDCLKIDGTYVQNICNSRQDQHVVRAIIELCSGFGIASTAEFIEDAETLALLREYGVTYGQGFHISRPKLISEGLARDVEAG